MKEVLIGNRVPKEFFLTFGKGESDLTIHAGSYHLALKDAGIEMCNIMEYSSILPAIASQIKKPKKFTHGSVMETIMAVANGNKGKLLTAGIIFGWLFSENDNKFGGLVCEYHGNEKKHVVEKLLRKNLEELHINGYESYHLKDIDINIQSFIPTKKFGTILVALAFINHIVPINYQDNSHIIISR